MSKSKESPNCRAARSALPGRGSATKACFYILLEVQIPPRARAISRPFWGTMAMQDSVTTMRGLNSRRPKIANIRPRHG
ncbi:unnamed protein product [Clavelina lepadiformis]|uniref:Uncharacterized protein n=1 Tax=Clavelina lepadiformis TaxID=159417 RepID=A0ABP0GQM2_CLALP